MGLEIERKFLIKKELLEFPENGDEIKQGYITNTKDVVVRVRTVNQGNNQLAFLTIKGKNKGITRTEIEKELDYEEAIILIEEFCPVLVEKTRYMVEFEGNVFEIDVFEGENEGLIIAEIELESEEQEFKKPKWLGKEVSDDKRYYNNNLLSTPFKKWE